MGADKRIPVTESTWEMLGEMKGAGETYDELIGELIEDYGDAVGADDGPDDWREEIKTRDGDGGETCPECGEAELVESLGSPKACLNCGWSE